ncbi:MAG TPA: polysaccharide pyruvyl transferase family protein [Thermoanaerobaculia bacterium]|nr:polysaccharide pyruvyl transferase family protein [Thermoanaerobaculia bacterium]
MAGTARRILIAGYYGYGNAGDEAILAAMLAGLRSLGGDGLSFTVAGGDPARIAADHGVRAVSSTDIPAVVDAVRESDLVVLGGGGLFQDYWPSSPETLLTPAQGGLAAYLAVPALAGLLGRPLVIYGVGIGPLGTDEGRRLTRIAFELCQGATVRDRESLELLSGLGLPEPGGVEIELAADPAFDLPPAPGEEVDRLLSGWGVAPGEPLYGVALRHWSFGPAPEGWEEEVGKALDLFLAGIEGRLLFLPFHTGGLGPHEHDPAVHRRVREALTTGRERAILVEDRLGARELAGAIARCRLVLAMRFHAALFTLRGGAPVVALAYDPKVASLLARAGLSSLSLPPERWQAGAVLDALRRAGEPRWRETLSGFAGAMAPLARQSAARALEVLAGGAPELPESRRFLGEVAIGKVLATVRQQADLARLQALVKDQEQSLGSLDRLAKGQEESLGSLRALAKDREEKLELLEKQVRSLEGRSEMLEQELEGLREQRDIVLSERNEVARRLYELEGTIAYRLISRLWGLMRLLFPEGSRRRALYRAVRRVVGRFLGKGASAAPSAVDDPGVGEAGTGAAAEVPDPRGDLLHFEDQVRHSGALRVVALFSATQLLESEGQRPTQLALTLARRGIPVIFVYWRWWDNEWLPQSRLGEGIVQIPIDVVAKQPEMLTSAFRGLEKIAFFEFPWPGFFETLAAANSAGWITLYDVLDDWEEFHRVGQAIWYDEEFERHMIGASDAVFAINEVLAGRIRSLGGDGVEIVGNGLKPGLEVVREPKPLERGEITVGYFGYLAGAWFDWELIAEAARLRPSWRFYLIGYGGSPEGVRLPDTVHLLGKQPQRDLAAYAANWDVALIPFKPDRLAAGADPIKTYEYLAMGLPVVATGVHPPSGGEAFVLRAEGVDDFLRAIEEAAGRKEPLEADSRRAFAASCTWDHRLDAVLASIEQERQRVGEKRALFGSPP